MALYRRSLQKFKVFGPNTCKQFGVRYHLNAMHNFACPAGLIEILQFLFEKVEGIPIPKDSIFFFFNQFN